MNQSTLQHSYEEVRDAVIGVLIDENWKGKRPSQFIELVNNTAEYFEGRGRPAPAIRNPKLHPQDEELVRDVFWELFRLGFITIGMNNSNTQWPFFRLSHRGQAYLENREPWKFHDTSSYFKLLTRDGVSISSLGSLYLDEALQSFYADCHLAASVMLGVAAEAEFTDFLETYPSNGPLKSRFDRCNREKFISGRIKEFRKLLPDIRAVVLHETEDLETNLDGIQAMLRTARNETGHPTGVVSTREQVYVNLQLFIPFARKLHQLKLALSRNAPVTGPLLAP